ncbi:hypothetical protein BLOT_001222, partial [Blomia tropicalis]
MTSISNNSINSFNQNRNNSSCGSSISIIGESSLNDIEKMNQVDNSFCSHLMKLETLAKLIGVNLLIQKYKFDPKRNWLAHRYSRIMIFLCRVFLLVSLLKEFLGFLFIKQDDHQMMLYFGDFSCIYCFNIDRFIFNIFKVSWGLHSTILYIWITKENGQVRTWLTSFEKYWQDTRFYVNKRLEHESLENIRFGRKCKDLEYALLSDWSINTKPEHISKLIYKHFYVCEMVKQANKHLKFYLFVFYIIFTPHLCLMIYYIIFDSSNFEATQARFAIETIVILCDLFQLYCISVFSAQITLKSHEPYYTMHGVNKFKNLPDNVQLQSTLFMQRISNTVVGLTILDSFVLTGGLISSLLTAIVTYFSVILEICINLH